MSAKHAIPSQPVASYRPFVSYTFAHGACSYVMGVAGSRDCELYSLSMETISEKIPFVLLAKV